MTTTTHETILILGATGKTGSRIADRLRQRGHAVRLGSRSGTPRFDWDDRSTWADVARGAGAAYLSYYPDLAVPGAAEQVGAFAQTALDAGVRRLVLLSGRGEPEAQRAEQAVQALDPTATVVRCSWFAQNFSEIFFLEGISSGTLALPFGDVREPFVDVEDIADVAVAALTEDGHAGRLYELTGPRLLSFAEAAAEIGRAAGREVAVERVPLDAYTAFMREHDVPEDVISLVAYLFGEVLDGRNESLADGVRQALGRDAGDFADYARRTAATGVWSA